MNKYIVIAIIIVVLVVGGIIFQATKSSDTRVPETGVTREVTVQVKQDTWTWDPNVIEANQGDRLVLTVINHDTYDHGFAIDAFGISQRVPAEGTIKIEFVASKAGEFPYYCSVSCGSGVVDGVERGHFDQIGTLRISNTIAETQ